MNRSSNELNTWTKNWNLLKKNPNRFQLHDMVYTNFDFHQRDSERETNDQWKTYIFQNVFNENKIYLRNLSVANTHKAFCIDVRFSVLVIE